MNIPFRTNHLLRALRPISRITPPARPLSWLVGRPAIHPLPILSHQRPVVSRTESVLGRASWRAAFTTSAARLIADQDLADKLAEEIKFEASEESKEPPEFIKSFLASNPFKIEDKPGVNDVALTRTFGNERIRVLFDISNAEFSSDSENLSTPSSDETDDVEEDEDDGGDGDNDAEDGEDSEDDEDIEPRAESLPVRCAITIVKDGKGALAFDTVVDDGMFMIEHVSFFRDGHLASDYASAESDWKRRGLYTGPQFDSLEDELQIQFEKYLEERGINTSLALFIPSYAEHKEQKEYVRWLKSVRGFIVA